MARKQNGTAAQNGTKWHKMAQNGIKRHKTAHIFVPAQIWGGELSCPLFLIEKNRNEKGVTAPFRPQKKLFLDSSSEQQHHDHHVRSEEIGHKNAAPTMSAVNSQSCQYCYIDLDVNNHRSNLALVSVFYVFLHVQVARGKARIPPPRQVQ